MNHRGPAPQPLATVAILGSLALHLGAAAIVYTQRVPLNVHAQAQPPTERDIRQLDAELLTAEAARATEPPGVPQKHPNQQSTTPEKAPSPINLTVPKDAPLPAPAPRRPVQTPERPTKVTLPTRDDWLSVDDQLPVNDKQAQRVRPEPEGEPARDELVERIMRREREKALLREQALRAEPEVEDDRGSSVSPGAAAPSLGKASVRQPGVADPETALLHALPAAVALAPWSNPSVQPRQVLNLTLRFKDGALDQLEAEPRGLAELESLRRNAFELLRHERFDPPRGELKFNVVLTLTRVSNNSLPALGFTPARLGADGSAYVIFPSGLRVSMRLTPLDTNPSGTR